MDCEGWLPDSEQPTKKTAKKDKIIDGNNRIANNLLPKRQFHITSAVKTKLQIKLQITFIQVQVDQFFTKCIPSEHFTFYSC